MPIIMIDVVSENLDKTIDLDSFRDYLHIGIRHISKTYDSDFEENVSTDYYNVGRCVKEMY